MLFSISTCLVFIANTEHKISLLHIHTCICVIALQHPKLLVYTDEYALVYMNIPNLITLTLTLTIYVNVYTVHT